MNLIALSFSARMLGIVCFSLLLIPAISYAENYTIREKNQSITIVINPPNIIVKPTNVTVNPNNTIIVKPNITVNESHTCCQSQNEPSVELKIGNTTGGEENSGFSIEHLLNTESKSWNEGDVVIASSTIFAFFGFGSFLVIRFENRRKEDVRIMVRRMRSILVAIFGVQLTQIYVLMTIMLGIFSPMLFILSLITTGLSLYIILRSIRIILDRENQVTEKYTQSQPKFKNVERDILQRRLYEEYIKKLIEETNKTVADLEKKGVDFKGNDPEKTKNKENNT